MWSSASTTIRVVLPSAKSACSGWTTRSTSPSIRNSNGRNGRFCSAASRLTTFMPGKVGTGLSPGKDPRKSGVPVPEFRNVTLNLAGWSGVRLAAPVSRPCDIAFRIGPGERRSLCRAGGRRSGTHRRFVIFVGFVVSPRQPARATPASKTLSRPRPRADGIGASP